ncbi:TMV resistance protein N isoform X1 [Prunus yedoensis var. nudiflora]|uniref:TMV resistance protein N isoform X1 n=1 Tax=Prunus yedoensis var. nudiflora TaxID=2094558 RepID=A0A314UN09_PRUYE|nr:TMV resistance protein N isoform X1 [Prunus yedoensis var. nudiflora]
MDNASIRYLFKRSPVGFEIEEGHVRLTCSPLLDWFHLNLSQPLKPDYESTSLSSASKTSLGKRPRESDFMELDDDHCAIALDIGDHEAQWLTLFTGPADHPKRRHIDLNEEPKYVNPLNVE